MEAHSVVVCYRSAFTRVDCGHSRKVRLRCWGIGGDFMCSGLSTLCLYCVQSVVSNQITLEYTIELTRETQIRVNSARRTRLIVVIFQPDSTPQLDKIHVSEYISAIHQATTHLLAPPLYRFLSQPCLGPHTSPASNVSRVMNCPPTTHRYYSSKIPLDRTLDPSLHRPVFQLSLDIPIRCFCPLADDSLGAFLSAIAQLLAGHLAGVSF